MLHNLVGMKARKMISMIILSIEVTAGDFNGHNGRNPENYENQHGGYDYGVRSKERERILEFCAVINMTVGNTLFKKRASHLVIYEYCLLKSQVDYSLVRRNQRKFGEECITQHKPLECDFKIRKVKDTRRNHHEDTTRLLKVFGTF